MSARPTCCPRLGPFPPADTALSGDNRFLLYSSITPEVHLVGWQQCYFLLQLQCLDLGCSCTAVARLLRIPRRRAACTSLAQVRRMCSERMLTAVNPRLMVSPSFCSAALWLQVNTQSTDSVHSVANVTDIHETLDFAGAAGCSRHLHVGLPQSASSGWNPLTRVLLRDTRPCGWVGASV